MCVTKLAGTIHSTITYCSELQLIRGETSFPLGTSNLNMPRVINRIPTTHRRIRDIRPQRQLTRNNNVNGKTDKIHLEEEEESWYKEEEEEQSILKGISAVKRFGIRRPFRSSNSPNKNGHHRDEDDHNIHHIGIFAKIHPLYTRLKILHAKIKQIPNRQKKFLACLILLAALRTIYLTPDLDQYNYYSSTSEKQRKDSTEFSSLFGNTQTDDFFGNTRQQQPLAGGNSGLSSSSGLMGNSLYGNTQSLGMSSSAGLSSSSSGLMGNSLLSEKDSASQAGSSSKKSRFNPFSLFSGKKSKSFSTNSGGLGGSSGYSAPNLGGNSFNSYPSNNFGSGSVGNNLLGSDSISQRSLAGGNSYSASQMNNGNSFDSYSSNNFGPKSLPQQLTWTNPQAQGQPNSAGYPLGKDSLDQFHSSASQFGQTSQNNPLSGKMGANDYSAAQLQLTGSNSFDSYSSSNKFGSGSSSLGNSLVPGKDSTSQGGTLDQKKSRLNPFSFFSRKTKSNDKTGGKGDHGDYSSSNLNSNSFNSYSSNNFGSGSKSSWTNPQTQGLSNSADYSSQQYQGLRGQNSIGNSQQQQQPPLSGSGVSSNSFQPQSEYQQSFGNSQSIRGADGYSNDGLSSRNGLYMNKQTSYQDSIQSGNSMSKAKDYQSMSNLKSIADSGSADSNIGSMNKVPTAFEGFKKPDNNYQSSGNIKSMALESSLPISDNSRLTSLGQSQVEDSKFFSGQIYQSQNQNNQLKLSQDSSSVGLECASYGGPVKESDYSEIVYWRDIPTDASFASPYYNPQAQEAKSNSFWKTKYLTFEMDDAGWNNMRLGLENVILLAHSMGRTLVLPPKRQLAHGLVDASGSKVVSFSDFYDLDAINARQNGLNIITMEQFLERESISGHLQSRLDGQVMYPPDHQTKWDNQRLDPLWKYIRDVTKSFNWAPKECVLAFPAPGTDDQHLFSVMADVLVGKDGRPFPNYSEYQGRPVNVDAPPIERFREILAGRRKICMYDKKIHDENPVVHFKADQTDGTRLINNFYAFLWFEDWRHELWSLRFVRDNLR